LTYRKVARLATTAGLAIFVMLGLPHFGYSQDDPPNFSEPFNGAPAAPVPFSSPDWDVTVHSRDRTSWYNLEPMAPEHGPACEPPPATHAHDPAYDVAVFLCRDHLMTAINAQGYALIYVTPNRLLDFSQGEAVLRIDVSTLRHSQRDWWDVWLSPYD
jgi:hypothetical protein